MSAKVVLFYPPYDGDPLGPPVCLLALAATLREAGFHPVIIDAAIDPDYKQHVLNELDGALCLGISVPHRSRDPRRYRSRQRPQSLPYT